MMTKCNEVSRGPKTEKGPEVKNWETETKYGL